MGISIDDSYLLLFSDNQIVIIAHITSKVKEEYQKWGLEMNLEKAEYLAAGV